MTSFKKIICSICLLLIAVIIVIQLNDNEIEEVTHAELVKVQNLANSFPTYLWYMGSSEGYDFFHASLNKTSELGYAGIYKVKSKSASISDRFVFTEDTSQWLQYFPPVH